MSQRSFLTLAALVPGLFGLVMMLVPTAMLDNSLTATPDDYTIAVTRWVGFGVFSVAWMTFFSRDDPGSSALRAVMSGSIVFHVLGIVMDASGYLSGTMTASGLVTGLVPHGLLAAGFLYFLARQQRAHRSPTRVNAP